MGTSTNLTTRMKTKRVIKAWAIVNENGKVLGAFPKRVDAIEEQKFFILWTIIVPATIHIPVPKTKKVGKNKSK